LPIFILLILFFIAFNGNTFIPLIITVSIIHYALIALNLGIRCVALYIINKNKGKIANPFKHMVYDPKYCDKLGRLNSHVELKSFTGVDLTDDVKNTISLKESQNHTTIMAYNDTFRGYKENAMPKILWELAGSICIFIALYSILMLWASSALESVYSEPLGENSD